MEMYLIKVVMLVYRLFTAIKGWTEGISKKAVVVHAISTVSFRVWK
jgi:hypothetical protein